MGDFVSEFLGKKASLKHKQSSRKLKMNIFKKLLYLAILSFVGLTACGIFAPVEAAIVCEPFGAGRATWPQDGLHAFRCINTVTGIRPTDSRANTLFNTLSDTRFPATVEGQLASANAKFFFFNNQTEADQYFKATSPYNLSVVNGANVIRSFDGKSLKAQCGNTGMVSHLFVNHIAVAIYDNCAYATGSSPTTPNPNLPHNIIHETGHAYDFSFASGIAAGITASRSQFWRDSRALDRLKFTPSNWSSMTISQKNAYVCNVFNSSYKPSGLEFALGASHNGGTGSNDGRVCQQTSPAVPYPYFASKTPTNIADEKINYFINQDQEAFAETFSLRVYWLGSSAAFLAFSDRAIGNNTVIPRTFNCTRSYMDYIVMNGVLPKAASAVSGCPSP